ncbi:MAG: EAL domain-containing protein [Crinalium sp.]
MFKPNFSGTSTSKNPQLQNCQCILSNDQQEHEVSAYFCTLSQDLFCVLTQDGYFQMINSSWEKLLGYTNEELIGQPYLEFVHLDNRQSTLLQLEQLTNSNNNIYFENRYKSKDGSYKWLLWNALSEGEFIYAVGSDITERKIAEVSLNCAIATIEDAVILQDIDGNIKASNVTAEINLGISAAPIIGDICVDSRWREVRADGSPLMEDLHPINITLHTGKPCKNELIGIYKPDDSLNWYRVNTQPLFLSGVAKPDAVLATFTNITESKQTQERLRLLESAVVNTNDAIMITEPIGAGLTPEGLKIVYVNHAFTRITGFDLAEVIGKTPEILYGINSDRSTLEQIRISLQSWEPIKTELINYGKNNSEFWVELNILPLADKGGKFTHWLWVERDITARKLVDQELIARARATAVVAQLGQQALGGNDLDTFLDVAVTLVAHVLEVEYCQILQLIPEENALSVRAGFGWQPNIVGYAVVGENERSQAGYTLLQGEPVIVEDLRVETRFSACKMLQNHQVIAGVTAIIHSQLQPFGVLGCHTTKLRQFTKDDVYFLQSVANVVATAIERKQAEEALKESEERYALAVKGSKEGLWDWNLKADQVYYSPRWKAILGYEDHEIGARLDEWLDRIHAEDIEKVRTALNAHLEGLISHFEKEYRILHQDGSYRWMLCRGLAIWDANGQAYRMSGSQIDITDRKIAEEQLSYDAVHDALTSLPNRALLMDRLGQAIARQRRHKNYQFAVLFLDLDRFKVVNDSLGHLVGDQLLIEIAKRLQAPQRQGDTVARLGGDEFVILLDEITDIYEVTSFVENLQKELEKPINLDTQTIFISASIGIVLSQDPISGITYDWAGDLLRNADIAMYQAKALGKARYVVFNSIMHTSAVARLQLENDLRQAVEQSAELLAVNSLLKDQIPNTAPLKVANFNLKPATETTTEQSSKLLLHYQPIISLSTGKIIGFEALVRLWHPQRGMISPGDFIPVAEETNLIMPLGAWVLQEACRQLQIWNLTYPGLTISVNISGKQLSQPDLVAQIKQILQSTNLAAHQLKLEITESVIMENAESATAMLEQLKNLGVQLSIDDFGTGYSSLSYLHRFPIDTLKVDRSFVSRMSIDGNNCEIVQAIITLAHTMRMDVTAEGVETVEQLEQLRALKCEQGQGYFFSKPIDVEAASQLLAKGTQW